MSSSSKRGSGVLLHISSLPNEYGIGTVGKSAYEFIDFLHSSGQRYWQILPLTPIGASYSPYQSYSAFDSNHLFLDFEILHEEKLLCAADLQKIRMANNGKVNFAKVSKIKELFLRKAFDCFDKQNQDFIGFVATKDYLDYACYMTLKKIYNGKAWHGWAKEDKFYSTKRIKQIEKEYSDDVLFFVWLQFQFEKQWQKLKTYANEKGVSIIGDMPIYLDYDSVECWRHPELLQLDEELKPLAVAGVPPDYFSKFGQLWGNPLYAWDYHKQSGYKWWKKRINQTLKFCDLLRIDHFRGFHEYYQIPINAATAIEGEWKKGAGSELFQSLPKSTRDKIIAEDLGHLDKSALDFFATLGFPGMKVLQFAFDGNPQNPYLPPNYDKNCVVYTGTHDNDTLRGWLSENADIKTLRERINQTAKLLGISHSAKRITDTCNLVIEIALASVSNICIIPIQDYLLMSSDKRMNTPGTVNSQNWSFRLKVIPHDLTKGLYDLALRYKRV